MNVSYNVNCLPPEILQIIFQLLPDHERLAASQVCRQWEYVMSIPQLWRTHSIDFNGDYFFPKFNHAYFKFVECYIPYFRCLKLRFNSFTKASALNFKKVINLWLQGGGRSQFKLTKLSISIEKSWNNTEARKIILRDLIRLLQHQHYLQIFDISLLPLTNVEAEILLAALSTTCSETINSLHFDKFVTLDLSDLIMSQITDFPNLQILQMNYVDLSSELLHLIAVKNENKFKKLILNGIQDIETDPAFLQAWHILQKTCPDLIVTYERSEGVDHRVVIAQDSYEHLRRTRQSSRNRNPPAAIQ